MSYVDEMKNKNDVKMWKIVQYLYTVIRRTVHEYNLVQYLTIQKENVRPLIQQTKSATQLETRKIEKRKRKR